MAARSATCCRTTSNSRFVSAAAPRPQRSVNSVPASSKDSAACPRALPSTLASSALSTATVYRIEKVIFESQPGFYVTANLYLPATGKGPFRRFYSPSATNRCQAYPVWQQILATFARPGYVALTWDQIGQGERIQHWDEALGNSKAAPSTTEHTLLASSRSSSVTPSPNTQSGTVSGLSTICFPARSRSQARRSHRALRRRHAYRLSSRSR